MSGVGPVGGAGAAAYAANLAKPPQVQQPLKEVAAPVQEVKPAADERVGSQ